MKVLLLGGTGGIGKNAAAYLANDYRISEIAAQIKKYLQSVRVEFFVTPFY